ncbi:MAG: hypothetical protein HQM16_08450 [Deltaproteobacteria bacterium]|nr:hypothetical protein [Deltaproteobacteria bacterium]
MIKYIKILFFLTCVFFGLYFFGDFRINDTNVRDFLRSKVTPENIRLVKTQALELYGAVQNFTKTKKETQDMNLKIEKALGQSVEGLPLDKITEADREKLIKIINDNLNTQKDKK